MYGKPMSPLRELFGKGGRTALIVKNVVASFLIKGWTVAVQLALVPLTLHCLGNYENGVWLTISSMLLWIDNLDIGLGNGLRNKLAERLALGDEEGAREAVSSTVFMLFLVIVPVAIALNVLIALSDTYSFLNVDRSVVGDLDTLLALASVLVCSTFIFKFIGNFYMGLQLPAVNNLLVTSGQTLALIGTLGVYLSGVHSLLLIGLVNTASPLVVYLACWPVTFRGRYARLAPSWGRVTRRAMRELFSMGMRFFVLQVAGILLFLTTNIIISRVFSPGMVTPYQVAYRYFSVIILLFTIVCVPYWTATTDAYHKGDMEWIRRSGSTLDRVMLLLLAALVAMVALAGPVYRVWVGSGVDVPRAMSVLVAAYVFILALSTRYSYVLNGMGALRIQLLTTVSAAVAYVPLAVLVGGLTHDVNMLLGVMCLVNLPGLALNYVQYRKIVNLRASGIWLK